MGKKEVLKLGQREEAKLREIDKTGSVSASNTKATLDSLLAKDLIVFQGSGQRGSPRVVKLSKAGKDWLAGNQG